MGDNIASLAIYGGTATHWRTRHLKIRARAFQEKLHEGSLPAYHIAGEWNAADIGTKALGGTRHWKLCDLLGLKASGVEIKKVQGSKAVCRTSVQQGLRVVLLACCLCYVKAQPDPVQTESAGDVLLGIVIILVMISAVAMWEAAKALLRATRRVCIQERSPAREPESDDAQGLAQEQPDAEDELPEVPLPPPAEPPEREERERLEREVQVQYEEGVRRRGARVYLPEPDIEPAPAVPRLQSKQNLCESLKAPLN